MKKLVGLIALMLSGMGCVSTSQLAPDNTYAVITGALEWKSKSLSTFSKENRRDQGLYDQLKAMGVPEKNMELLLGKETTNDKMLAALEDVASRAGKDATIIFYYAGHGYPAGDAFFFASYDAGAGKDAPEGFMLSDIAKVLKKSYKGKRVLLMADCCYSGALGHVAKDLSEAGFLAGSLSAASDSNLSGSNWTFTCGMIDVLQGRPLVDLDGDGYISFFEAAKYTGDAMNIFERQRAGSSRHGMKDSFRLSKVSTDAPLADPIPGPNYLGQYVNFPPNKRRDTGRIIAYKDGKLQLEIQRYHDRKVVWKDVKDVSPSKWPDFSKQMAPKIPPKELSEELAAKKATVDGKYSKLLRKILIERDHVDEGAFTDYGIWRSAVYGGYKDLPDGYWVYVYPNWYIFGETSEEKKPQEAAK
jgi:hypothetical protein